MSEETEACAARWSAEYAGLTGWPEFTLSSTEGSRCPVATPSQPLVYRAFSAEEPLASATMSSWESIGSPKLPPRRRLLAYARFFATQRSGQILACSDAGPNFPAQRPIRHLGSRNFGLVRRCLNTFRTRLNPLRVGNVSGLLAGLFACRCRCR